MDKEVANGVFEYENDCDISSVESSCSACEFFSVCYANNDTCIKKDFDSVLRTLTKTESTLVEMLCGFKDKPMTRKEVANNLKVSENDELEIEERAFKKLRRISNVKILKNYIYMAYTLSSENFYRLIIEKTIGGADKEELFAIKHGVDLSIFSNCFPKFLTINQVKQELILSIQEIEELQPYCEYLARIKITTLDHLLHTSRKKLLYEAFERNDALYFEMMNVLNKMGYKLKGNPVYLLSDSLFIKELEQIIVNNKVYEEEFDDLPIETAIILFKNDINNIEQLVDNAYRLNDIAALGSKMKNLENFLSEKGLLATISKDSGIYLSKKHFNTYIGNLVRWMIKNGHSIFSLCDELVERSLQLYEACKYINCKFPDFELKIGIPDGFTIEEMDLSLRSYNLLKRNGIDTILQLITKSAEELKKIPRLTEKNLEEIESRLNDMGFSLKLLPHMSLFNYDIFYHKKELVHIDITWQNMSIFNEINPEDIRCFVYGSIYNYSPAFSAFVDTDEQVIEYLCFRDSEEFFWKPFDEFVEKIKNVRNWDVFKINREQELYVFDRDVDYILKRSVTPYIMDVLRNSLLEANHHLEWAIERYSTDSLIK